MQIAPVDFAAPALDQIGTRNSENLRIAAASVAWDGWES
jgi:hypothetical protein